MQTVTGSCVWPAWTTQPASAHQWSKTAARSINAECGGINCHVVVMEEERTGQALPLSSSPLSHIYMNTCKYTWPGAQQHGVRRPSSADSCHGYMRLFGICITDAARHSQKQDTENRRRGRAIPPSCTSVLIAGLRWGFLVSESRASVDATLPFWPIWSLFDGLLSYLSEARSQSLPH